MKSMTGYGKAKCVKDGYEVTIELKSVNNRFLDINMRLPKTVSFVEDVIRRGIGERFKRGTVEIFLAFEDKSDSGKAVQIDMSLARAYIAAAKKLRTEFLLDEDFQLAALLRSPEVLKMEAAESDAGLIEELVKNALSQAIDNLDKMRENEGSNLKKELALHIQSIESRVLEVEARAPKLISEYRVKLKERIKEALAGVDIDEARLINEVAFFADKADICEEIARLYSHLKQFKSILEESGEQGRRLDFLTQEINREVNTIGSKSSDTELTSLVVNMKNDIEKLREQIRNIE